MSADAVLAEGAADRREAPSSSKGAVGAADAVLAVNPADTLERQNEKLIKINRVLMRRVEQARDEGAAAYAQFERAAVLEGEVRARTRELERALGLLNDANGKLADARSAAEAARANLAGAIEAIREGFALFDQDDRLVLANSRFSLLMPDVRDALAPGMTFGAYVDAVARSAELALPDEGREGWAQQRRARHQDEHVVFNVALSGARWVQVSEHRTAATGTVILQTDVTEIMRRQQEERDRLLDDQARMVRATLEHITEGVTIFDAALRLAGANARAAELLALPIERFAVGTGLGELFAGLVDEGLGALRRWVDGARRTPLAAEVRRGRRVLHLSAQAMPDGGLVVSFTDVTAERDALVAISEANETLERRVAERTLELEGAVAAAERANATKSRFVAAASHDLLQPLSAAKLYLSALEAEAGQHAPLVGKVQSALGSVESILGALLDISRLEAGGAALDIADVPLGTILRQLGVEFQPLAAQRGLQFAVVPSSAVVRSDRTYLRRILQNLISNAVKYTETGRVLVGVRRQGEFVRVEVWDTGPGIPEESRARVFQEFQRLGATASASAGLGLGLAIVDRACAVLRHPLTLASVVGRGSAFIVTLPLSARQEVAAAEAAPGKAPKLRGKVALLVVADEELRTAMATLLETWGLGVVETTGAEEAVALLAEIGIVPDVALFGPARGDATFGASEIRRLREGAGPIPAAVVTAHRGADLAADLRRLGATVLGKPIDPKALQEALARICGV